MVLDVARGVAQRIELRQHVGDIAPALGEIRLDEVQRVLQLGVDERRLGVVLEARRGGVMGHRLASDLADRACVAPGAPIGGVIELAGQHFGHMAHGDRLAVALQFAGDVHETAEVAAEQHVGAGRRHGRRLLGDHGVRDVGILDAERAAEAAAGLGVGELLQHEAFDRAEQPARLAAHAAFAQARAGIVIGDGPVEARFGARDAEHVDEELGQFVGLRRKDVGARLPVRIALEQLGIVHAHLAGAGAGGRDDIVAMLECGDHLFGDRARRRAVAGVEGRLAAAGLRRHVDCAARLLQQLDGGEADRRPDQIDEAGDQEAHARLGGHDGLRALEPHGRRAQPRGLVSG